MIAPPAPPTGHCYTGKSLAARSGYGTHADRTAIPLAVALYSMLFYPGLLGEGRPVVVVETEDSTGICKLLTHTYPRGLGSESRYAQLPPLIARKLLPMGARERDLIISLL
jgi:hypothetical protein